MKQVLIRKGNVFLADVPAPRVEPGHLLVEVAYSLISTGTELSTVQSTGASLAQKALKQPEKVKKLIELLREQGLRKTVAKVQGQLEQAHPTGYSCSGIVIEAGEGVSDLRAGDAVACAGAGIANHAEIVLVPRNLAARIPDGCSLREAASMTLGAIAMQGVRRAEPRLGEIVAVTGLGLLGLLTVQLLKAAGCRVIGLDTDARRVEIALRLGADRAFYPGGGNVEAQIQQLTDGYGVDATIITAASESNAIVQQAMEITRKKGKVVVVGAVGLGLNRSPFYEKEIDFLISTSYGPGRYDARYEKQGLDYPYAYTRWTENRNMQEYLRLLAEGKVRLDLILEKEYEISQAAQAYQELQSSLEKPLGVLLRYPASEGSDAARKRETQVALSPRQGRDRIRLALIGAGNFARETHLPNLQNASQHYHLRAIISGSGSNARALADLYRAEYAGTDYRQVLDDPDVDAVLICTPHHLHAGIALEALRAGKHVLVEKPLALNPTELDCIKDFYRENQAGPVLLTGTNRRFSPHMRYIRSLVEGRTDPLLIVYRMNAGHIPSEHWIHSPQGGGRNLGEACHIYDLFTFLTDARSLQVGTQVVRPRSGYYKADDNFVATISFEDGSLASLTYTSLGTKAYPKEKMDIFFDGRVITMEEYRRVDVVGSGEKGLSTRTVDKGLVEELRLFALAVKGEHPWPNPLWQQIQAMEIAFAVEEAIMEK